MLRWCISATSNIFRLKGDYMKVDVFNTSIVISDYEWDSCPTLQNNFKIRIPVTVTYTTYDYFGIYYDKENKKLYLPRGIDIWYLESILNTTAIIHKNEAYKYDKYNDFRVKKMPRDEVQEQALRFMVGRGEYRATATKSQLSLNLNTGKGKTYVAISTIAILRIKALIIMYSTNLIEQWKNEILDMTNLTNKQVKNISGSINIKRLMNRDSDDGVIYLITHGTLESYAKTNGWEAVGDFVKHLRVGIKIFDEAHQNFENMLMIDFFTNVYKNYYLTATALRSSTDEDKIYQLSFKNVPRIDLFNEEEDPHTRYTAIKFSSNPSAIEMSNCKNQYGLDRNKYVDYLVSKPKFYSILRIMMDIAIKRTNNGGKCLMYIGTNAAIQKVYEWMVHNYSWLENDIGILSTLVSSEERKRNTEKRIMLSTTKSAGTGIDIKGLVLTILLAEPFKSGVLARQTLGRTRDSDTEYIELVDTSFPQCRKYYGFKKPIFLKYATDCREMIMTDDFIDCKLLDLYAGSIREFIERNYYNWNVPGMVYNCGLTPGMIYDYGLTRGMVYDE